jgi:mono/diheme cytochrome c family protein
MKKIIGWTLGAAALIAVVALVLMVVFEDPHVAHGRVLYAKFCAGCHGVKGYGDGFNAEFLDPHPRDLTDSIEPYMAEGTNEEIYSAIATGVAGYAPPMEGIGKHVHDHGGGNGGEEAETGAHDSGHDMAGMSAPAEEDHAHDPANEHGEHAMMEMDMPMDEEEDDEAIGSPLMPYWGFTMSDQEIWELVAYIRTLHSHEMEPVDFESGFDTQRRRPSIDQEVHFPPLNSPEGIKLVAKGEKLITDRYACNACHRVGDEGGQIGPDLNRSGVRLNPKWIYRWIQDPQSIRRDTTMPAFGLPEEDAVAVTLYLTTLRAPAPPAE